MVGKKNKKLLIYLGINFAISQILFYLAYELTTTINASLAQKTTIIFGILFGYFINHEKISYTQIIFSVLLFFGLALAVTQGSFNLLEFDLGVIVMIITTILWILAHAITKPALDRNEITSLQLTFIRNFLNGIILLSLYFLFFPLKNISLIFNPINQIYFILMGFAYGFDIFFWYKAIKYTEISTTSIVTSPAPLLTVLLAVIILGDIFTVFHLIGALIIIISIIFIVKKNIIK